MRCHEARSRLTELRSPGAQPVVDREILDHLSECTACAALVQADRDLCWAFMAAKDFGANDQLPLAIIKSRVEAGLKVTEQKDTKEISIMRAIKNQFAKRSRLGFSMAVAVVILAATTLIPLKYDKTVGYEVALAGVDKNLALDSEKISQLIAALGIEGAAIDVLDCDIKCNMKISDLKSQTDADMIAVAFKQIDGDLIIVDVNTIKDAAFGTWIDKAKNTFVTFSSSNSDDEQIHRIVVEKLACFTDGTDGERNFTVFINLDSNDTTINIVDGTSDFRWIGDGNMIAFSDSLNWGPDGNLPPEILALIENSELEGGDMDVKVIMIKTATDGEAGGICQKICIINGDTVYIGDGSSVDALDQSTDDDAVAKSATGELPETFGLSQNYPNPFNPTTQIDFLLPAASHVTLEIINIRGQVVNRMVDRTMEAGAHTVEWNGTNEAGSKVASGVYLYRLRAGNQTETKKMTLTK